MFENIFHQIEQLIPPNIFDRIHPTNYETNLTNDPVIKAILIQGGNANNIAFYTKKRMC